MKSEEEVRILLERVEKLPLKDQTKADYLLAVYTLRALLKIILKIDAEEDLSILEGL